jgi:ABC-2 type transport system ATP-binding protein
VLVTTAYLDEAERTNRVGLMYRGSMIRLAEPQVLKDMVEGVMMELVSSDLHKTRQLVSGLPGVLDVNVFGDGLHVRIKDSTDVDAIATELRQHGIEISSFRKVKAAMEDAFLSIIPH